LSSVSVPRPRSRDSSASSEGGAMKMNMAYSGEDLTESAPCTCRRIWRPGEGQGVGLWVGVGRKELGVGARRGDGGEWSVIQAVAVQECMGRE
jgi:hypothetical protein